MQQRTHKHVYGGACSWVVNLVMSATPAFV